MAADGMTTMRSSNGDMHSAAGVRAEVILSITLVLIVAAFSSYLVLG